MSKRKEKIDPNQMDLFAWADKLEKVITERESLKGEILAGSPIFKQTENEVEMLWKDAADELKDIVDIGSFIIAEDVEKLIRDFLDRAIGDPELYGFLPVLEDDLEKVLKCLADVKEAAKKDLKIKFLIF